MTTWFKRKYDGGSESNCTGFWLVEAKRLCSIVVLRFRGRSREAYHTHAFDAVSWVLRGELTEEFVDGRPAKRYTPSILPVVTPANTLHRVHADDESWVLSFRGPWAARWAEVRSDGVYELTTGRKEKRVA